MKIGHFLGQVKGQVSIGHHRSNLAYFNFFLEKFWAQLENQKNNSAIKAYLIAPLRLFEISSQN